MWSLINVSSNLHTTDDDGTIRSSIRTLIILNMYQ